jgi:hypothetical protein
MKKNNTFGLKVDSIIIMFAINALLMSVFIESITVEVNGLLSINASLLPSTNATEDDSGQNGTIASFPGSLDSDRRHVPLL